MRIKTQQELVEFYEQSQWISVDEQNPPIKTYVDVWVEERKMSFMAYMDEFFQWQCALIDLSVFEIKYFKRRDTLCPKY